MSIQDHDKPLLPLLAMPDVTAPSQILGNPGVLQFVDVARLRIDPSYQRAISIASAKNVNRIISGFDWRKFTPVIGTENEDATISVIDGQHRATAAISIGIDHLPCYILPCSVSEAAAAFAAINGNVTTVNPIDIWFAQVKAQDADSIKLSNAFDAANVRVVRKKDGFAVGETRSINVLRRAHEFYGSATFITILQCITETGNGNPGMIFGATVNGIGRAIRTKPELLAEPSKLFDLLDRINLSELHHEAILENAKTNNPVQHIITRKINSVISGGKT
tara:strand:+ start:2639 stop:3472 length:834 start_codon:yes stop_codon:yes gene_type:complete